MLQKEELKLETSEKLRYDRQIKLAEFGLERQLKLKAARVLLVGAGGLGNPLALYLAGAGVGSLGIADFDSVDVSNLHRQVAFKASDAGKPKVDSLIATLRSLNSHVELIPHGRLNADSVSEVVAAYDLVIDGTDSFASRFLIADACYLARKPLLHGAVHSFRGQLILFENKQSPCFRCLYAEPPGANALPPCGESGILGVITGSIALMMATEAIKFITGLKTPALNHLLTYDGLEQTQKLFALKSQSDCPLCGPKATIDKVIETGDACIQPSSEIAPLKAQSLINDGAKLIDVREPGEYQDGHLSNAANFPLSTFDVRSVAPAQPVIVYCKSGKRSQVAVEQLRAAGLTESFSIQGGLDHWYETVAPAGTEESPIDTFLLEDR